MVKLRVGFDLKTDLNNLSALREVLPDGVALAVDANQHFTLPDAVMFASRLELFGVHWIEEPIDGDAVEDLARFYEMTGLPVATGENVYEIQDFVRRSETPGVRIIQPDVTKVGGITRALKIIEAVDGDDVAIVPHIYGGPVGLAATLALAATSERVAMVEYDVRTSPLAVLPVPVQGELRPFVDHAAAVALLDRDDSETHVLVPSQHSVAGASS
jgi:L-alanine-DL-glutamate epimerase-like enolase superfamily enzyme